MGFSAEWWAERRAFQASAIDPAGLERLVADVVPGGSARAGRQLRGGIESATNALDLTDADGRVTRAVLKRMARVPPGGHREWTALHAATAVAAPTPEPIGFDPDGTWFGVPGLVMSRLDGRPRWDHLREPETLTRLARALAAVHDAPGDGLDARTRPWDQPAPARMTALVERVWATVTELGPGIGPSTGLVHSDFHPGNVLWSRGRISGIVDWEDAAVGRPAQDLAVTRVGLTVTHGAALAGDFLEAYWAETHTPYDDLPLWEMVVALSMSRYADLWLGFLHLNGFTAMTVPKIRASARRIVLRALREVGAA